MEISIKSFILYGAVILTGLSAGLFYAWSVSVIPGTQKVGELAYLETMQSINRAILNPAFYLIFFGSLFFLSISSIYEFHSNKVTFWLFLSSSIFYLIGTFGVTILGNVPLNNQLEALDLVKMNPNQMKEFRTFYEANWNRLHLIRTVFAVVSFLLSVLESSLIQTNKINNKSKIMNVTNNILVIGGTGKTGRKVAEGLKQRNQNVRIGSRNGSPSFEWEDPSTWPKALEGMDKVYIVFYPDLAVPGAAESIEGLTEAAKKAGVKKAVLLSGKGEKEAERCEQIVANSGLEYTLVRASWFNQNFSESFFLDPILAGHIALPMPDAKIPFVDTDDIAEVVVETLISDAHNGQTYEITGPRAMVFEEAITEIANATGRDLKYQAVSQEEYNNMLTAAGVPSDYIWLFDYLFREVLGNPSNQIVTSDVEKVLGRKAIDFKEYAKKTVKTGVWNPKVAATM